MAKVPQADGKGKREEERYRTALPVVFRSRFLLWLTRVQARTAAQLSADEFDLDAARR